MSQKKFTTIPHDYCITFSDYSVIKEAEKDEYRNEDFKGMGFNFKTIKDIEETIGLQIIDLIAIVTDLGPLGQI